MSGHVSSGQKVPCKPEWFLKENIFNKPLQISECLGFKTKYGENVNFLFGGISVML